jgi:hypothetical protein
MTFPTDAPYIGWDWDVVQDADMNDAMPPLRYNGAVIDLTGCDIEIYIRPTYDFDDPIDILTTAVEITIDNAALGLASAFVAQAFVAAWPVGEWQFFLRVIDGVGTIAEVARGPFRVHAGNIAT